MPDLILEVGTEEMPAGAIENALAQLKTSVEKGLEEARLSASAVEVCGTPRRLIVKASGVPAQQADQQREVKGPAKSAAYDASGNPTGAAIGFAKKQGIDVQALEIVSTLQGDYVLARVNDIGKPATEVLGPLLAEAVKGLYFPKMMRWGTGAIRFVRPVRWVLCLLDTDVVPMEFGGVESGRRSRGHRFLAPSEFEVWQAGELLEKLRSASVLTDPEERRDNIRQQANELAKDAGGSIPWDEGLLDENTWLVEYPTALLGSFAEEYLSLPRPVLVTAMKKHQRFFPVEGPDGALLPNFIAIRNGGDAHLDIVRDGDERVLTARFSDASYFYKQDQNISLDDMATQLGRLIFQEKLGTIAQKRERLILLVEALADSLGLNAQEKQSAIRAAELCKADLVSHMVIELPSLQGVMGREYALAAGEDATVANAIAQHYLPRSASDSIPDSRLGALLALADRLDTLVGYVGVGILPSGSSDPYGLRRAAQGVVQLLASDKDAPSLVEMQAQATGGYKEVNGLDIPLEQLSSDLSVLFNQRLTATLEEKGVRYDLIDSALLGGAPYSGVAYGTIRRGEAIQSLSENPEFIPTVQAAARVANILRSQDAGPSEPETFQGDNSRSAERALNAFEDHSRKINLNMLEDGSERELYDAAHQRVADVARRAAGFDYSALFAELTKLNPSVNQFFDDVMVMVEDEAVRKNRLSLLAFVDSLYKTLADFTKVVVA
jgi:glycyl-tRNA synthetase beta chain